VHGKRTDKDSSPLSPERLQPNPVRDTEIAEKGVEQDIHRLQSAFTHRGVRYGRKNPSCSKALSFLPAGGYSAGLNCFYNFVRTETSGTDISPFRSAFSNNLDPLYVRQDDPSRFVVGVAYIVSHRLFLAADITNSHFDLLNSLHI
jgi:hypothetical protein